MASSPDRGGKMRNPLPQLVLVSGLLLSFLTTIHWDMAGYLMGSFYEAESFLVIFDGWTIVKACVLAAGVAVLAASFTLPCLGEEVRVVVSHQLLSVVEDLCQVPPWSGLYLGPLLKFSTLTLFQLCCLSYLQAMWLHIHLIAYKRAFVMAAIFVNASVMYAQDFVVFNEKMISLFPWFLAEVYIFFSYCHIDDKRLATAPH